MKQLTLKKAFTVQGIGLHTGQNVKVTVEPAPDNFGYKFQRVDLEEEPIFPADANKVTETNRGTTLTVGSVQVATVEHLLSALRGNQVDNVLIKIDGPEMPILDGSAVQFSEAIHSVGLKEGEDEKEYLVLEEPIEIEDPETGSKIIASPSDQFEITTLIDFNSPVLGQQYAKLDSLDDYNKEIARCRTFVFVHEIEALLDQGLIKGGDLDNAIVIANTPLSQEDLDRLAQKLGKENVSVNKEGVLNTLDLHFQNEPARHKLLDVIGDLALVGSPLKMSIVAHKPGHKINTQFAAMLKKKLMEQRKLKGKPTYDPNGPVVLNVEQIQAMLPHRFPFLLVDKVVKMTDQQVVGVKNITFNEQFFQGHFPGNPIFPGVLQLEALAQTGGILALSQVEDPENWDTYFLKINNAKFKHKVVPGDTLVLKLELMSPIRRGIVQMSGTAYVGNKLVSEGELTAQIVKRK